MKVSILSIMPFGNFSDKPIPRTDKEVLLDKTLSERIIKYYDDIFGTNVQSKVGNDYSLVLNDPSIEYVTSGDVLRVLIHKTKIREMDIAFIYNNDNLIDVIFDVVLNKKTGILYPYFKKNGLAKIYNKKSLLYNLFLKQGEYFNLDIVKSLLEIKNKKVTYEVNSKELQVMDDVLHSVFFGSYRVSIDRFNDTVDLEKLCLLIEKEMMRTDKERLYKIAMNKKLKIFMTYIKNKLL